MSYRILITGADSFIGTSCERYLAKWPEKYIVDTIDMTDLKWQEKSFRGYDVVFHVAGIAHQDTRELTEAAQLMYRKVNCDLAIETAKKAKAEGVKQFIYMSSMIVFGVSGKVGKTRMIDADSRPAPVNYYGRTKLAAEEGIQPLADDSFRVVIMRPPMIYGQGCKGNYPRMSGFVKKAKLFPKVRNCRSMLYIENFAEFLRLVIENGEAGVFYPQNEQYTNTSEMVKLIAEANGRRMVLLPGLGWLVWLAGRFDGTINKVFGSLSYDRELSKYKENYCIYSLEESVRRTEAGEKEL